MSDIVAGTGIWSRELRYGDAAERLMPPELDELGYTALWFPDIGGDVFGAVANLLAATRGRPSPPGSSTCGCTHPTRRPGDSTS